MEVFIIPTQKISDQTFYVELNGKDCEIHIYTRYMNTYIDLTIEDKVLFQGQICLNRVNVLQYGDSKLNGELMFVDTQGNDDPYYKKFNDRWYLVYVQQ